MSLPGYLITCVLIAISTLVFRLPAFARDVPLAYLLLVLLVQAAAVGLVFLLADRVLLRHRRERPASPWLVVAISVAIGLVRIVALVVLNRATGHQLAASATPINLLLIGAVTGGVLLPVSAVLLSTIDWYRAERERLIAADVRLEVERMQATGAIETMRELVLEAAYGRFDATRTETAALLEAVDAADERLVHDSSSALLRAARLDVRDTSHALWAASTARYPRIHWLDVLASAARLQPLPERIALPAAIVVMLPALLIVQGLGGAMITAVALIVAGLVLYPLGRRAIRALPALAIPLTILVAAATSTVAITVLLAAGDYERYLPRLAGFVLGVVVITLLTSAVLTALRSTEDTLTELRAIVSEAEIETRAAAEARHDLDRELAAFLHGTLQTRLVAAAYEIENAQRRGDQVGLADALASARAALDDLPRQSAGNDPVSLGQARQTFDERWTGALALTWDLPAEEPPAAVTRALTDVIQECLSNALIHGHATAATIIVRAQDATLEVTVVDNGIGPQDGAPGLGATVLASVTGGTWELAEYPGGAIVRAVVPC
ncbi:MAG: hypothetical protein WCN97_05005 [Thermoleophilia bacterium]